MPNLDGGHYFLTVLAPIRVVPLEGDVGRSYAHRQQLAQKLALIATGRQTAASPEGAWSSPFARNTLNHFARFVIIDAPAFNGRTPGDTLVNLVRKINPLAGQSVDRLGTAFLLFAADIDAPTDGSDPLEAYAAALWATMRRDLEEVFSHCVGFDAITSAPAFCTYLRRCQVETTMPFNDYWPDGLPVGDAQLPLGALKPAAIVAGAALVLWLVALLLNGIFTVFGGGGGFAHAVAVVSGWGALVVPLLILTALIAAFGVYRKVTGLASAPLPTAPGSDLPAVLKSLFIQQSFTGFAIGAQGLNDAALHARFGAFLNAVQPAEPAPTQGPGEIRAPRAEVSP